MEKSCTTLKMKTNRLLQSREYEPQLWVDGMGSRAGRVDWPTWQPVKSVLLLSTPIGGGGGRKLGIEQPPSVEQILGKFDEPSSSVFSALPPPYIYNNHLFISTIWRKKKVPLPIIRSKLKSVRIRTKSTVPVLRERSVPERTQRPKASSQ